MLDGTATADPRTQTVVMRLLRAVDRSIAANREVAEARAELDRLSGRSLRLIRAPVGVSSKVAELAADVQGPASEKGYA